ncbi:MAG: hypothetical protein ACI9J3_003768 [Parvicellaceae bacterium]|jgi:uncharacterized iron-regulated protein
MKKMTCSQLGGACEEIFQAETFDQMIDLSKKHGMEMFAKGDQPHLDAMKGLIFSTDAMNAYIDNKRKAFDTVPEG